MKNPFALISAIISTNVKINNKLKYSILQVSCAMVHFMLIFIFLAVKVYPMVYFNIASTVCYILCGKLVRNEKFILFYYITFAEICLHSYTAAILVGWESGFPMYIIGITPVIFYMHFSLSENTGLGETVLVGICAMIIFITCKLVSGGADSFYSISESYSLFMYIFNTVCTFLMLLFFSLLFLREIKTSRAELEEQNARLDKMAGIDALTGLYNRRSMDKFVKNTVSSGMVYSFIMCDIDDFKSVNDTYGHGCGDMVLKNISGIIASNIRDNDFVCRWGGEEILILANNTDIETASAIAERIRGQIEDSEVIYGDCSIKCTITVGISDSNESSDPQNVISAADVRLYKGKKSGKNCVVIC